MKRIILLTASVLSLAFYGYSQCTPDLTNTHVGITPDSAPNLPHAVVGTPYSTVMQIRVPLDTSVLYMGFPVTVDFDSVILSSFTGMPTGYTYACNPSSSC